MTIKIEQKLPGLNQFVQKNRQNRYAGAAEKKRLTAMCADAFRGQPPLQGRVHITFIWYEKDARRDMDNVSFAKKFILDGMQAAGVLVDDSPKYVSGFTDNFVYGKGYGVTVVAHEVE